MHFFKYRGNKLYAEGVGVQRIAKEAGTPVYIYSQRTLKRHLRAFDGSFKAASRLVCFSVKANSNISVLKTIADEGSGFDIVSGGELYRALKAGGDPRKIVFPAGKREDEIEYAVKSSTHVQCRCPQELRLDRVAGRLGKRPLLP